MSNRRRISRKPQTYNARLQRRTPGRLPRPPAARRAGWYAGWAAAALAVIAEAGHLWAAYLEWPGSTARGVTHTAMGALLGLVVALLVTGTSRRWLAAGAAIAVAGPAWWLGGTLLDAPPYRELPGAAAAGVTVAEVALAALIVLVLRASPVPMRLASSPG